MNPYVLKKNLMLQKFLRTHSLVKTSLRNLARFGYFHSNVTSIGDAQAGIQRGLGPPNVLEKIFMGHGKKALYSFLHFTEKLAFK